MELNQLRTFQLVASHKSFSRAAEELHLTQPAVTQQIKNLENELGEPLFDRLGRSQALTPAGEVFLIYTQQILNLTEQAADTVRQFSQVRGRLTIGAGTTNTIFRLPEILRSYREKHPQIEIRIRSGSSDLITGLVYENAVDFGLVTTVDPLTSLEAVPLFRDRILLIAPPDYPDEITTAALEKEPLILFRSGSGFRRFLEEQFRQNQLTPQVGMELESIEAIIRLVHNGLGLAFLPEIAVSTELAGGALKTVWIEGWGIMARQTYLIYRRDKYLSWPIKAFFNMIVKQP